MLPTHSCATCHTIAAPTDRFCASCGSPLTTSAATPNEPDFVPLDVVPTFDDPEPTGLRRFTDRFSLPRLRHG